MQAPVSSPEYNICVMLIEFNNIIIAIFADACLIHTICTHIWGIVNATFCAYATFFKKLLTKAKEYSIISRRTATATRVHFIDRRKEMFEDFKSFLVEELRVNPDAVTMEAELAGDLGINSLELADMVYACEEKFNVTIDDEALNDFKTVGDVVRFLEATAE